MKIKAILNSIFLLLVVIMFSCNGETTSKEIDKSSTTPTVKNEKKKPIANASDKIIVFFGNSLTAGYQLDEKFSFPSLIQQKITEAGKPYKVVNAGLSGDTTHDGLSRIDWVMKQPMDIFVLELGANDMLRGLDVQRTEENLKAIIKKVRAKHKDIPIVIAGMLAPSNMGKEYEQKFNSIFSNLAKEFNAGLIPFLLEDVAGIPSLNLPDGKHPNEKGQEIVANNVWSILKGYL